MATHLPDFKSFDIHTAPTSLGIQWEKRLENLFVGMKLGTDDDGQKQALLLYYAGEDVNEIYDTLGDATGTYAGAKGALNTYFTPTRNLTFEVLHKMTKENGTSRNN